MKISTGFLMLVLIGLLCAPRTAQAQVSYEDHVLVSDGTLAGYPAVGIAESGDFIVVWHEQDADWDFAVWGQRFWAAGLPKGSPYQISSTHRGAPRVAMARDGRHVVIWGTDYSRTTLEARAFNSDGSTASAEIVISDKASVSWNNWTPYDVAISDIGDFLVVWASPESPDPDADGNEILGQRFDFDGTPAGISFMSIHQKRMISGIHESP